MKRILFDVPRWHVFLHREARGLEQVDRSDPPQLRFEDKLFDRLYAGGSEQVVADSIGRLAAWAQQVHEACSDLPDFGRLSEECRGDADAAGIAMDALLDQLRPLLDGAPSAANGPGIRKALRLGCSAAGTAVDEHRDVSSGLEHVSFGLHGPGTGSSTTSAGRSPARSLARRLHTDTRLKRIALLAGRFKRIAANKRRSKVHHGSDEVTSIERGSEFGRLLPIELLRLRHPWQRLALHRDLIEGGCLQYALTGAEANGKGPLIVCLDKSGSMDGPADIWATAVALALLDTARRERRPFGLICFDAGIKLQVLLPAGASLPDDALFVACTGGTDIGKCLERGLDLIESGPGAVRKADLVLITDGQSDDTSAPHLRARARTAGVTILGFGIGIGASSLEVWCDEAHAVRDLASLDDAEASALFAA